MNIGLVGTGKMGAAIFKLLSTEPVNITVLAINQEEAEKNQQKCLKGLKRHLRRGRVSEDEYGKKKESLRFTHKIEDLASSEMVIEAIFEDFDEKTAIFHKLESVVDKKAILVSNTSSISITELEKGLKHADRFCGLHFFHPVMLLTLVEIIKGAHTPDELVGFLRDFCESFGRRAIVVVDAPGSVLNAILAYYYVEALYILEEGCALPSRVDELARRFFYVGPCESMDVIGIDFFIGALKRAATPGGLLPIRWDEGSESEIPKEHAGGREGFCFPALFGKLVSQNRLGKKTSKGIYLYEKDKVLDDAPQFYANPAGSSCTISVGSDELIAKRLLYSILNGAIYSVQNGICSMEDLDFGVKEVLLMKEGPFTIIKTMGAEQVREDFDFLAKNVGKRFKQRDLEFIEG